MEDLSTSRKGATAEAAITALAIEMGIIVLRPVAEGGRYDLVFDVGTRLLRVQCKWARKRGDVLAAHTGTCRHTPHGYLRTTYTAAEVDAVVLYCRELHRAYLLPIEEVEGLSYVHLRLAPARNNQRAGVRMAHRYELGAVAQLGERRHGMAEVRGSIPLSSTR